MSRPKKKSAVLPKAEKRLSGMKSISSQLDFGNGLSNVAFESSLSVVRSKLDVYNTLLSKLDEAFSEFKEAEQTLSTLSENMLLSVAIRYGKTSTQYEMAGGVRRGERRRTARIKVVDPVVVLD
jgi:outer membrane protein TolC